MLDCLAELETHEAWLDDGAHDMPHWVSMQLGVSRWKAERWVAAGAELRSLPADRGRVRCRRDRHRQGRRADPVRDARRRRSAPRLGRRRRVRCDPPTRRRATPPRRGEAEQIEQDRWLAWRWTDEGKRLLLEAEMPAAQGAVVTEALDRLASEIPAMPGEEHQMLIGRRRVDALAIACGSGGASEADATVVIHVQVETLADDRANARTDDDVVLPIDVARRFLCNAKIQTVVEAADGSVVGLGRTNASRRRGCSGSSATATARARSRGAATGGSRRRTTSAGGHAAGRPTSTTSRSCARSITGSSTSTDGPSSARRPAPSGGSGQGGVRYRAGPHAPPRERSAA